MTEKRSGRDAETQRTADQRGEQRTKQTGDEVAHDQPPNPEPAEGPRDSEFTRDTWPQTESGNQEKRVR